MYHSWKNHSLGIVCFLTTIIYLVNVFMPSSTLHIGYSLLAGVLLAFGLFCVNVVNQVVVLILLGAGSYFFYVEKVSIAIVISGFGQNINLLTLFILVPLFGVLISTNGYLLGLKEAIRARERNGDAHPYRLSNLLTATLGAILNLGSLPIVYRTANESFSQFERKKLGMVLLRAFGFCMLWSPYFVNVGLVLVLFNLSWLKVGMIGLAVAFVYFMISLAFFKHIHFKDDPWVTKQEFEREEKPNRYAKKLLPLLTFGMSILLLSLVLDAVLAVNMLTVVSVLSLVYPLLWASATGVGKKYLLAMTEFVTSAFLRLKNEIVIFVSAGFFGVALSYTDIGERVSLLLYEMSLGSIYLFCVLIILFAMMLSFCGIHPVIIVIGIGSSLSPALFGVSPEFMAVLLIMAWTLATQVSPFSGSVLMTAGLIDVSPWEVARKNLAFVLVAVFTLPMVLHILLFFKVI